MKSECRQKQKPELMADILKKVVGEIEKKDTAVNMLEVWERAVEKNVHEHARPVSLKQGSLVVVVDSSPWLYEITTKHKKQILVNLKKELGAQAPTEIKLKIGNIK